MGATWGYVVVIKYLFVWMFFNIIDEWKVKFNSGSSFGNFYVKPF